RPSNPPETRLARVGPWLDDLLKGDATEAARVIGDALAATNRVSLSESRRLELSEKYHTTAQALWPNLERQFSRAPHPLSGKALLLALANPYGFLPGQLAQVVQYLQEYSHWAKITDVAPVHRLAKAVAIVPLGHDFPPFSANKGGNIDGSKMFLLTFDLAFQIQEQLRVLDAGGKSPANVGIDAGAALQYTALLRRLLRQWAIPPARQFNRLPSRARVVMCAGLAAVWQYSRGTHANVANPPSGLPPMHACQVINHTPAGYALRQIDASNAPLR